MSVAARLPAKAPPPAIHLLHPKIRRRVVEVSGAKTSQGGKSHLSRLARFRKSHGLCSAATGFVLEWPDSFARKGATGPLGGFGTPGSHRRPPPPPPTTFATTSGSLCDAKPAWAPARHRAASPPPPPDRGSSEAARVALQSQRGASPEGGGPCKGCPSATGGRGVHGRRTDPGFLCKAPPPAPRPATPVARRSPRRLRAASPSPAWQAKRGGGL